MAHPTVPLEVLLRLHFKEKLPIAKIAQRVGLTRQTVYTRFRAHGISILPKSECSLKNGRPKIYIGFLYEQRNKDVKAIAKFMGCSVHTVYSELARQGIPLRPREF